MKAILRPLMVLGKTEFWISLLIVFYIFLATIWLSRDSNPITGRLAKVFSQFILTVGLDQNWSLFSPTLRNINMHNVAMVTFRDGSVKLYEWPRMDRSNRLEQWRNEKYRKMFIDCIPWPTYSDMYPSVARFVARANANPNNPPEKVSLGYFWNFIPQPEQAVSQENLPYQTKYYCYYIYEVQPRDWL